MNYKHNFKSIITLFAVSMLMVFLLTPSAFAKRAEEYVLGLKGLPDDYYDTMKVFTAEEEAEELPSAFNWKQQGKVTVAKDQGSCGSCWAFTVAGAIESKILMMGDPRFNLSEQHQVSCNTAQQGCDGGRFDALIYYDDKGPMTEACTAYPSKDGSVPACSTLPACSQLPYHTNGYYTVDTTSQVDIKTSLYNDGPAFFGYGVYTDFYTFWNTPNPGAVYKQVSGELEGYHAVLLIGWDDAKGAWLFKNSWGATDGPNGDGTFWMAYEGHATNVNLGMANTDVKRVVTPVIPKPVAPVGDIYMNRPAHKWKKVYNATHYNFQVYDGATRLGSYTVDGGTTNCGENYCTNRPALTLANNKNYEWRVKAKVGGVWKNFSNMLGFRILKSASGFNTQFNGSAPNWTAIKGSWSIADGNYYYSQGLYNLFSSAAYNTPYSNFTYEVRMKRAASSSDGYSNNIVIRGNPADSGGYGVWVPSYMFQYLNRGYFSVFRIDSNGTGSALSGQVGYPWVQHSAITPGWNTLKVVANGSSLKFYINGVLVWSGSDNAITTGKVGFEFFNNTGPLYVDWATLTTTVSSPALTSADTEEVAPGGAFAHGTMYQVK